MLLRELEIRYYYCDTGTLAGTSSSSSSERTFKFERRKKNFFLARTWILSPEFVRVRAQLPRPMAACTGWLAVAVVALTAFGTGVGWLQQPHPICGAQELAAVNQGGPICTLTGQLLHRRPRLGLPLRARACVSGIRPHVQRCSRTAIVPPTALRGHHTAGEPDYSGGGCELAAAERLPDGSMVHVRAASVSVGRESEEDVCTVSQLALTLLCESLECDPYWPYESLPQVRAPPRTRNWNWALGFSPGLAPPLRPCSCA